MRRATRTGICVVVAALVVASSASIAYAATPSASVGEVRVVEPAQDVTKARLVVRLSHPSRRRVVVLYSTVDGTGRAGEDYVARSGRVVFRPGVTRRRLAVNVLGDGHDEPDETFGVVIARPRGTAAVRIHGGAAVVTVVDADPPPTISIADASPAGEGAPGAARFAIDLSAPSERVVKVAFATHPYSAVASDFPNFAPPRGTITIAPGRQSATVVVPFKDDAFDETDETFTVELAGAENASLGRYVATGTIVDDDPPASVAIEGASVGEGAGHAAVHLSLTGTSRSNVIVHYETVDGSAVAGDDYMSKSGVVSMGANTRQATIAVILGNDALDENDETLRVRITAVEGAAGGNQEATVTIQDDDPPPTVDASDVTVTEGDGPTTQAVMTVALDAPSGLPVSVGYQTADGTALSGDDYETASGTLTFAPGQTSRQVVVGVLADMVRELDESAWVQLANPVNATLGADLGAVVIVDDDAAAGSCPDDSLEENDDRANASTVAPGASIADLAICPGDPDVYSVTVPAGQTITAAALPDAPLDLTIEVQDAAGFSLSGFENTAGEGGTEVTGWTNAGSAPKTAFVRVAGASSPENGYYDLSVVTSG